MILVVCATELELRPLLDLLPVDDNQWMSMVSGVGVVETTLRLTRFLEKQKNTFTAVLLFGVAGAYFSDSEPEADLLDICLAEQEQFADFGICHPGHFEALPDHLAHTSSFDLDTVLLQSCLRVLAEENISCKQGGFLTVAGVSATFERGKRLKAQYGALCENMEGAAVARVCEEFNLPLVEMRCISNFVEDRDLSRWKLNDAVQQGAKVAAMLLRELIKR
jgi:futalosine hydrolase